MDYVGFKVASESDLNAFARRIETAGTKVEEVPAGEQPGLWRRLSFVVPTGHRVELYAEMALSEDGPMTRNPELWRDEPHGMRVTRFDHSNLHGPNIDQVVFRMACRTHERTPTPKPAGRVLFLIPPAGPASFLRND